ncbi:MAG: TonB-dependent receptor [Candidatus Pseudobacter hemicellulosilyticus]|uniref:TonB-dependent receptor n=1 Tax=Candidatus Pseudobacter hemicellulosilyticus TaxID=3121375 RepID=A0AAJ6BG16_9BACT|nr:MAG: TonB-dependent receptor [Pseudobacter sp.]
MKKTKTLLKATCLCWLFIAGLLLPPSLYAQEATVEGTILSAKTGEAISGATITHKGNQRTAVTNDKGQFRLAAASGDLLEATMVGYRPLELRVTGSTLVFRLEENFSDLDEVVVIGYGVQRKKLVTGANLNVKGGDIQKQSTTNALQALQGQAPGVQITTSSGQPGSGINVIIRGKGTVGNFGPLYVVDGVNTYDIAYLNPADIESIDVLKDAASAAIYGSQAANGVVLITTRTGRAGKSVLTYDGFIGVQNVARKAELLDAREYSIIMNESAVNSGKTPPFSAEAIANPIANTDWMDQMFVKDALTQNHVLGLTGGSPNSVFSMSMGYTGQEGIVGGKDLSNFSRYTLRLNSEHNVLNKLIKLGQHLTFTYEENNGIGVGNIYNNTLRAAFNVSPLVPMYGPDGEFYDNSNSTWNTGEANPYAVMTYTAQNRNNNQQLFGDVYLVVEPIKNLRFRTSLGLNYRATSGRSFSPTYRLSIYNFNDFTKVSQNSARDRQLQWDNQVSYSFNLKDQHHFDVMAGTSAIQGRGDNLFASNRDLVFTDLYHAWLNNATNTDGANINLGGTPYENALLSAYGRLQYNFRETYLLNFTFRADGSSKFAKDQRWGYFPSVSLGWVATNENFFKNISWLDFLKVRGSWGQVGNQNVDGYRFLTPVAFRYSNYIFGNKEGELTPGAYPSRIGNPLVKWETGQQTNIGFDATIARNLNVNFDFYIKETKDWLIETPILATAGAEPPLINGGDVKNTGVELLLSYRNKIGKLVYTVSANGAYNRNRIGNIPSRDNTLHGNTNTLYNNSLEFYRATGGYPVGYFWGLTTDGIFQSEAELASYSKNGKLIQPNAAPGDVRYKDLNGDGQINDDDRSMIGDPNPDYTYGFSISAEYRGFDFSLLASGVVGNQLVQSWRNHADPKANWSRAVLDRWHGPGSSNTMPRVTEDNRNWTNFSDLYIHDGDYLRISNVTLGYDLSKLAGKTWLSKARVYVAALNLFTFTKYDGMDPEIGYGEGFSSGVDVGYYPRPRTLMVGANIKF